LFFALLFLGGRLPYNALMVNLSDKEDCCAFDENHRRELTDYSFLLVKQQRFLH